MLSYSLGQGKFTKSKSSHRNRDDDDAKITTSSKKTRERKEQEGNSHLSQSSVYSGTPNFYGDCRVQSCDGGLEWLESDVFVGEYAKLWGVVYAESDTRGDVLFLGAEPGVALCRFEEVVEHGIPAVVVHGGQECGRYWESWGGGRTSGEVPGQNS